MALQQTSWQPRPYPQLLRGPRHRWWRPLVSLAIVLGALLVLFVASMIAFLVAALVGGIPLEELASEEVAAQPAFVLGNNLLLAALVPVSMLAVWAGHRWRPGFVSSVTGGIRWRWLAECAGLCVLVLVTSVLVLYAVDGWPQGSPEPHAVILLAIVLATTPLQAAGEEYFCRGWMTQAIGSLFARAVWGAVVAGAVTATLFAMAHGSQNAWLFLDRFAFGVLASYLVWRTGGLEAAIAAHAVNNVVVFVPVILTGGLEESLLVTEAPVELVLTDIAGLAVLGALLVWWSRRRNVQRYRFGDQGTAPVASSTGSTTAIW